MLPVRDDGERVKRDGVQAARHSLSSPRIGQLAPDHDMDRVLLLIAVAGPSCSPRAAFHPQLAPVRHYNLTASPRASARTRLGHCDRKREVPGVAQQPALPEQWLQ